MTNGMIQRRNSSNTMGILSGIYTTDQLQECLMRNGIDRVYVPNPIIDGLVVHCESDYGKFDLDLHKDPDRYKIINYIRETGGIYIEGFYDAN